MAYPQVISLLTSQYNLMTDHEYQFVEALRSQEYNTVY